MKTLDTYINLNGYPIIRRCENCAFWSQLNLDKAPDSPKSDAGYCKNQKIFQAYTLEKNQYFISKKHNFCVSHEFLKEDILEAEAKKITLQQSIVNDANNHNSL